jgi:polyphosphate kinase 2 (PPK2 family)
MFEGWDSAGKGGIIQRLTAEWDQRHYEVWPIAAPTAAEKKHDFLWRFARRLPPAGNIAVFDRSWYGRVLVERVEGFASEADWRRGYDEINAFEDKLIADGITLVKLFVHITQKEQDKRLAARLDDPWKRWKSDPDDYRNRAKRADYLNAMAEMFARTDRPESPWIPIDGNNKKAARIAAMTAIAEKLEQGVPMAPPPLDPTILAMAEQAFGYRAPE